MKRSNILLRISKKGKCKKQEGYVLGITLIILSMSLLLITSFLTRQAYHEDWIKTLQQTASTRLVAQNHLESKKDGVIKAYEKTLEQVLKGYKALYSLDTQEEKEIIDVLAATKAYLLISQSFFHSLPDEGLLYSWNLNIQEFAFRTPHLDKRSVTHVKSYHYVRFNGGISSLSKGSFVLYDAMLKKVKNVEAELDKNQQNKEELNKEEAMTIDVVHALNTNKLTTHGGNGDEQRQKLIDMIKSLQEDIQSKSLYEIVVDVKVKNDDLEIMDDEKMYFVLKLQATGDEQVPYKLVVGEYEMEYKS